MADIFDQLDEAPVEDIFDQAAAPLPAVLRPPPEAQSRGGYLTEVARGLTQFVPALAKTTSTVGDKLGNLVRRGVGLEPLPLELPESRPLYKAGQWMQDKLDAAYPAVPEPQRNIGHDVASGLGQMASMVAGGLAARGAGATLKGAALVGTALGFGQEFDDAFSRARQRGDDPDTAFAKSLGYATVAALIENKLGAGRIIKKYFPDPAEAARKLSAWGISKAVGTSLAVGFGEEGSQRFSQNWIVEGKPSLEGVVQEGAPGGIVQAIAELPATLLRAGGGRVRRPAVLALPQAEPVAVETPNVTEVQNAANREQASVEVFQEQPAESIPPDAKGVAGKIQRPATAVPQGGRADATEVTLPRIAPVVFKSLDPMNPAVGWFELTAPFTVPETGRVIQPGPGVMLNSNQIEKYGMSLEGPAKAAFEEAKKRPSVNAPNKGTSAGVGVPAPISGGTAPAPAAPVVKDSLTTVVEQDKEQAVIEYKKAIERASEANWRSAQSAPAYGKIAGLKPETVIMDLRNKGFSDDSIVQFMTWRGQGFDRLEIESAMSRLGSKEYTDSVRAKNAQTAAKPPELMTLPEYRRSLKVKVPKSKSGNDHFMAVIGAMAKGKPLSATFVLDSQSGPPGRRIQLREGYVREGDLYAYKPAANVPTRETNVPSSNVPTSPVEAPASDVSPKAERQPTTLQQLDDLIISFGIETGRIADLETLHAPKITETSGLGSMGLAAKRKWSEQIKTARERIASDLGISKDKLTTPEGRAELLSKLKERIASSARLVEVALDDMPEGSEFTIHGEKFTVKDTNEETGIVTLKDGRTLKVNERSSVKIDPGSLKATEATFEPESAVSRGGELGGEIGQTFNLVGEKAKFVEPTQETTAFGSETLSQNDLFQIEQVTKEVDPFKSADAAQRLYGGPAAAATVVERQLRTLDQNPEFRKQFDKKQRARLTEVLNLLRERATAVPEANIAERAIAGGESGSQIPFRDIGQGHAKFDDGLTLLVEARSLTDERAEIIRDLFRDTGDAYLGRFTIDARAMRSTGWASWQGKDAPNRKAWLKLKRGLADLADTSKEGFWAEPSNEPIVVFAHEYAHVAEYLLLTDADRALVKEVFQKLKADGRIIDFFREGMSTTDAYAKYYAKNWKEFLSESFAEYVISRKVPTESMRPILSRIYDAFKSAIARVFQRGAKGETAMLEPLYEKMLRGGEISKEGPTGEAMASGGAPGPPTGDARAREKEVRGSTIDPATGEWVEEPEPAGDIVQIAGIEYNIVGKERLTPEQKAAADTRARDFFGKELNLPGEPDVSAGKQRGAIDTNLVFKIEADSENHDDAGARLLEHLTEQIQMQHQPGGDPAYVSSLVNALNKNFNVGNLQGVFSDGMIQRLMEISVGESSWRGTMLRAITGITEDMGTVARNAKFFLRRTYENMFGGDLTRKLMDRIALNFRERFTGEEIERLYNESPILQELFLKVVSRLNVKPSLRDVISEIFATPINKQDDIVERFVDAMVKKFSATPAEASRLKSEFSRTFEASFNAARRKAQEKALASLLPDERKVIGPQTQLWKKLTDLVNSGWFDSAKVVEEYARTKGMKIPTESEIKQMRDWSIREQELRKPTAEEKALYGDQATILVEGTTLEKRQELLRKMNTQWSRWTHPVASLRHPSTFLDPVKRYNAAMAANEWLTANLLLKLGFGSRQIIDVGTQMVLHTPTRAAQYAFEQWGNDKSAGRDTNLLGNLSQAMTDAYRTRIKVLGDTLASFKRTLAGKGEQKNVEQLISSIAVFDRALLKADEMKAEGKPAAARFLHLLALTMRFGRQFAAAADVIQGVPAEAQEIAHQIRTGLREQGKSPGQQALEFNTILGLLTTARVESLAQAREILEARGLDITNASIQRAAWHILREKIYNMARTAGLPADEWKIQNHYYRNVLGWNEPETQGFGAIGGPGGLVAMGAKAGKELMAKGLGLPGFPFVFGNAMGISLNRKLAYTPLGFWPGFFKGSPWFEGERNIRQRKIEAVVGTTIGGTLFTLAALGLWVVLPRKWPDDEKEKAKWTANGWQPGMVIVPVSDTQEMKISTRVGPMSLLSPYLAAGGAFHDSTVARAKKQQDLNERAAKLGLTPETLEGLDAGQWLNVIGSAAYASAVGGRTSSGMLGSYTDFGQFSAKKSGAAAISTLIPGLPGFQEISRMAGANINPKLASFWDLLVPLPTSDANRVNLLGDPMRNENDIERIFQVLSGGTAPLPADKEQFNKNKAYTNLFTSDFRPPAINPTRGYQFGDEFRTMTDAELQKYTALRGKHFSDELQKLDLTGLTPEAAKKSASNAFQRANTTALSEIGAVAPRVSTRSAISTPGLSLPARRRSSRRYGLSAIRPIRLSTRRRGTRRISTRRSRPRVSIGRRSRSPRGSSRIRIARIRRPSISSFV